MTFHHTILLILAALIATQIGLLATSATFYVQARREGNSEVTPLFLWAILFGLILWGTTLTLFLYELQRN